MKPSRASKPSELGLMGGLLQVAVVPVNPKEHPGYTQVFYITRLCYTLIKILAVIMCLFFCFISYINQHLAAHERNWSSL